MFSFLKNIDNKNHRPTFGLLKVLKYIGPGLLVTVGFIDPGNWASNIAAGSDFGLTLLWMVTLSTIMLIILQHNVAHLGIATGLCLSEAATKYTPTWVSRTILGTAMMASVSTSLAEVLGGSIALQMLFDIPIPAGAILIVLFVGIMLVTNSYAFIEKIIIAFVSIIGLSFLYELSLVKIDWIQAGIAWVKPSIPEGSIMIVMSVLGAVVMPHNLFLHSEVIQSRQWNLENDAVIKRQLDYEFVDTLVSMLIGWAINSAMIILAASTFHAQGVRVGELQQAQLMLGPLLGNHAGVVFAIALLFAGIASSLTSGMAGGSIFAGLFGEPFDVKDNHSRMGIGISLILALILIFIIGNPFKALIISQMVLSIQLPLTIFLQIYLTSSTEVMGKYANTKSTTILMLIIGCVVAFLNVLLFISFF
ncbi:MAG TPA: Nramp family divalent metal transporter [Prolixibacteraceae bacterium]|nr:Nramp family divalent metal transporter [Prolixibacteraceae bacterium]